jgi:hypothetical protein
MAQRRYGPTRGAGVATIETDGEKQIERGALGWVGYAGLMEKGPVGELIVCPDRATFDKKCGGLIDEGQLPDAARDYFKAARGAGGLLAVRVTDGNEAQAEMTLYQRQTGVPVAMGTVKAKNGGRWGGKARYFTGLVAGTGDIDPTQLTTGNATFTKDQWKGGWLILKDVPNVRYPIVGNSAAGVIDVASDQDMAADYAAASGSDLRYYLYLENEDKAVSILIGDGEEQPDTEFSLSVYVDGAFVKKYANLHTDPAHARYWVNLINNDDGNDEIEVEDLIDGAHTASQRPANVFGDIATGGVTATTLTSVIHVFEVEAGAGDPTCALGATTDDHLPQELTITMTTATAGTVVSDRFGSQGTLNFGVAFAPQASRWVPPFTITAGGTPCVAGDILKVYYFPLRPGALVGGYVYPDKVNAKREKYRITANTHKLITVAAGSDLTTSGAAGDDFLVEAAMELEGGKAGEYDIVDADYTQQAWDVDASPFIRAEPLNLGLVKYATPGVTSTTVQQAGRDYAEAKNHQYRYECPSNVVTESSAIALVMDTLGRNDFAVMAFPSYCYAIDPDPEASREGKLKLVTMTGMIHGREARMAADWDGYHKAAAGIDATLSGVVKLPTGDRILNEELLNPTGIQIIKKKRGNFVIWGDRTLASDPTWKWKHQRELMSYYEQVLQSNFDFIVFAINDSTNDLDALAALKRFFQPEWVKRALRGANADEAAQIKVDSENNTDATRSAGDQYADVSLKLADTVERFVIRIGKQGIFEQVA